VKLAFALTLLTLAGAANADELVIRGNYWRDRNTRVLQPEADLSKELPSGTVVGAHYLLDAITSASVAAGVMRDQPFTELRNEFGFRLGQRLGPVMLTGSYSYSLESDYWAHLLSLSAVVDLFQKNTTLSVSFAYGHDNVGRRMGPSTFNWVGNLDAVHAIVGLTQVLHKQLLGNLEYDLSVIGFGSVTNGYQGNPYRSAIVGGAPQPEAVPYQRFRHAFAGNLHVIFPIRSSLVPYLAFRPAYRIYFDDWGLVSHTAELRTFLPIGPVELRFTARAYTQGQASFFSEQGGQPYYPGNTGKACATCFSADARRGVYITADPKLSAFDTEFLEVRLLVKLGGLRRMSRWLSAGTVELSYGHWFNDKLPQAAWGDAEVAGATFAFPL
jgi:hypothetical protein